MHAGRQTAQQEENRSGPFLHRSLHQALHPSICLSVHTIYSKSKSRRNFAFGRDMAFDTSNRENKFEVKLSKVKVTGNETVKIVSFQISSRKMRRFAWPLDSPWAISYWWSTGTDRLAVYEILGSKNIGVTALTFRGTWRHRSCDHLIPN